MVGIDAYFPLTEEQGSCYDIGLIAAGWKSGEGYDWYLDNGKKKKLSPNHAWKNIEYWWGNAHVNPDGRTTPWKPKAKPIWFTEYGFPSIDAASNQPNIFYNPQAIDGGWPKHSNGKIDFRAQIAAITATLQVWQHSEMVQNMFLWCYDARPYPFWPDLANLWRDVGLWEYGHWVNGKLNLCSFAAVITDICSKVGMKEQEIDVSQLNTMKLDGYAITDQSSARAVIEELQLAYFFMPVEIGGGLYFKANPKSRNCHEINEGQLVPLANQPSLLIKKIDPQQVPSRVELIFVNKQTVYEPGLQVATTMNQQNNAVLAINSSLVLDENLAKNIAEQILVRNLGQLCSYHFVLTSKYACLTVGDVIKLHNQLLQIIKITFTPIKMMEITAIHYIALENMDNQTSPVMESQQRTAPHQTWLEPLILLGFNDDANLRIAICGLTENWPGVYLEIINDNTELFFAQYIHKATVMGRVKEKLDVADCVTTIIGHL